MTEHDYTCISIWLQCLREGRTTHPWGVLAIGISRYFKLWYVD